MSLESMCQCCMSQVLPSNSLSRRYLSRPRKRPTNHSCTIWFNTRFISAASIAYIQCIGHCINKCSPQRLRRFNAIHTPTTRRSIPACIWLSKAEDKSTLAISKKLILGYIFLNQLILQQHMKLIVPLPTPSERTWLVKWFSCVLKAYSSDSPTKIVFVITFQHSYSIRITVFYFLLASTTKYEMTLH